MRGGCNGKDRGGRPAEQQRDRMREQRPDPAEVASYVTVAVELGVRLGSECAGEENSKEQEDNPPDLAGEYRRGGLIVPVPVRAS